MTTPTNDDSLNAGLAETAVVDSGRPVLVVPYVGAPAPLDGKILVAWNGTRQAARAANDAIPLMHLAKEVEVVAIHPSGTDLAGVPIPGADLCLHLARHGIDAQARTIHGDDVAAGDLLLSHIVDSGANMVVMGAYGHSRLRELVLGGMTRNIPTSAARGQRLVPSFTSAVFAGLRATRVDCGPLRWLHRSARTASRINL